MTATKPLPSRCTIVVSAEGARCDAPATASWVSGLTGETLRECDAHATRHFEPVIVRGTRVHTTHVGLPKIGTVESFFGAQALVLVPLADGTFKTVTRKVSALRAVRP